MIPPFSGHPHVLVSCTIGGATDIDSRRSSIRLLVMVVAMDRVLRHRLLPDDFTRLPQMPICAEPLQPLPRQRTMRVGSILNQRGWLG